MAKAFVRFAVERRSTPIHQNVGNIAPSVHFGKSAADVLSRSGGLSPSYPLSCPHVVENHAACPRSYPQNVHNSLISGFVIHNTPCIACRGPIRHGDKGNESARHPHAIEHGEIRTQSIHTQSNMGRFGRNPSTPPFVTMHRYYGFPRYRIDTEEALMIAVGEHGRRDYLERRPCTGSAKRRIHAERRQRLQRRQCRTRHDFRPHPTARR